MAINSIANLTDSTVAGSNTEIQYNNSGVFGASSNLTFDGSTLTVTGSLDSSNPLVIATGSTAQANVTGQGQFVTVDYGTEVVDRGSDFASDTFTAPEAGYYQISASFDADNTAANGNIMLARIVTSNRSYTIIRVNPSGFGPTGGQICFNGSFLCDMDASDTAYITFYVNGVGSTTVGLGGSAGRQIFSAVKIP